MRKSFDVFLNPPATSRGLPKYFKHFVMDIFLEKGPGGGSNRMITGDKMIRQMLFGQVATVERELANYGGQIEELIDMVRLTVVFADEKQFQLFVLKFS